MAIAYPMPFFFVREISIFDDLKENLGICWAVEDHFNSEDDQDTKQHK